MTKMYKIMFMITLMMGTLISVSSYSWMGMWLGLEINLLSIIPLFSSTENSLSSESSIKYFITQAMASALILMSIIFMMNLSSVQNNIEFNLFFMMILNSGILTKMGAAPFHFWFPEVMEGLSWMNCLLLLTWQKIAPMILLMYNPMTMLFLVTIIIFSMMISSVMSFNQISLRKIMAFSSINHIAWMLSSMIFSQTIWMYYFIIYCLISINIILIFNFLNSSILKQLFSSINNYPTMKMFFVMNFLSLSGLPPFLGFFPKWLTIQLMIENSMNLIAFLMVLINLIMLFIYMRITFTSMLLNSNQLIWINQSKMIKFNSFMMTFNLITITSLIVCTMSFNFL